MEKQSKNNNNSSIDILVNTFTEPQLNAIKKIFRENFWGDTDMYFGKDPKNYYAYGCYTNLEKVNKNKSWS